MTRPISPVTEEKAKNEMPYKASFMPSHHIPFELANAIKQKDLFKNMADIPEN